MADQPAETKVVSIYSAEALLALASDIYRAKTPVELVDGIEKAAQNDKPDSVIMLYVDVDADNKPEAVTVVVYKPKTNVSVPEGTRFLLKDFPAANLWMTNPDAIQVTPDVKNDPLLDEASKVTRSYFNDNAEILIPLAMSGQWLGVIVLTWQQPRTFQPEVHSYYKAVAGLVSGQVARIRTEEAIQAQVTNNALIEDILGRLSRASDEQSILDSLRPLIKKYGPDRASLSYFFTNDKAPPPNEMPEVIMTLVNIDVDLAEGVPSGSQVVGIPFKVAEYPIIAPMMASPDGFFALEDSASDPRVDENTRALLKMQQVGAVVVFSLYLNEAWQGFVTMQWAKPRQFDESLKRNVALIRPSLESAVVARRNILEAERRLKASEAETRDAQTRLQQVISNSGIIVYSYNKDGIFTLSEGGGLAALGLKPGQAVGMSAYEMYGAFPSVIASMQRALAGNVDQTEVTLGTLDYQIIVAPVFNVSGQQEGATGVAFNITERRAAEKERDRVIRELRETARFKDEFLATMSHELRTPLNAMIGLLGIVLMGKRVGEPDRSILVRARANSERLLGLINNILDISRMEAGRLEIVPSNVDIRSLVATIERDLGVLAEQKGVNMHLDIDTELPQTVRMDEDALNKIMVNLVSNAVKFTQKGYVTLRVAKRNDQSNDQSNSHLNIEVQDTGIGIPVHQREIIFESFRQGDPTSTRQYGGSGLGLSIVRNLVNALHGTIRVESEVGKGSTFIVTLPLEAAQPSHMLPPEAKALIPETPTSETPSGVTETIAAS